MPDRPLVTAVDAEHGVTVSAEAHVRYKDAAGEAATCSFRILWECHGDTFDPAVLEDHLLEYSEQTHTPESLTDRIRADLGAAIKDPARLQLGDVAGLFRVGDLSLATCTVPEPVPAEVQA